MAKRSKKSKISRVFGYAKKWLIIGVGLVAIAFGAAYFLGSRPVGNIVERTKSQVRDAIEPIIAPQATLPPSPTAKVLTGGYQTYQTFNNCGPASLSMVLRYFDVNMSQYALGDELRPYQVSNGDNDDKSTTLYEMGHYAESLGFVTYYRPNGDVDLIKKFISAGIPVITRTWLHKDDYIGHYRVVKGYDDNEGVIIQDDSFQGANIKFTYSDFNNLWEGFNYEYLVILKPEQAETAKQIIGTNLDQNTAWQNSLKISDSALASDPGNIYAQFNKSVAYYHLGQYQKSVDAYESVESKLPFRMLWYQIDPIVAYQKLGDYDRVLSLTQHLIENGNRAFSEVYQIRGEVYQAQGKTTEANAEFEKVKLYNKNFYKYWE